MSAERRPSKESGLRGWFSILTVGAIVVSAGLALGLVAGVTWEEPGLVIGWLTGETDGIQWGVDERQLAESGRIPDGVMALGEQPIGVPDVAAPPPSGGRAIEPSSSPPKSKLASSRRDQAETTTKAAEIGKFSVQVGAFAERGGAEELSATLRKAGYKVYLSDSRQGARWRVRVGPHSTRAAAENAAKRLEAKQQLPTWVLREDS